MLGYETSLNKFEKTKLIQATFSENNKIKDPP